MGAVVESFVELGVSVYDFPGTPEASQGMVTNLRRNVERLELLNKEANDPDNVSQRIQVPLEVVQYIEDGRNPNIYTREFVEAVRRSNQYQRAKLRGLRQLRNKLAEKIVAEFPEMTDVVGGILERTGGRSDRDMAAN